MLTDSNNIYKMCPIYNQIISREAQIGDYILTYNSVGVVIHEFYDKFDDGEEFCYIKYHNLLTSYNLSPIQYRDYSSSLRKDNKEYVVITKELFDIIINNISDIEFKKIYDIVHTKNEDDDEELYYIYMMLYRLHTYLNATVTDEMDKMILLSFGIKKVLKKHKNNGLRDVLLGNGQVWQLKKRKAKGMLRKNIITTNNGITRNSSYKKKIKTVHYTIIKRLS